LRVEFKELADTVGRLLTSKKDPVYGVCAEVPVGLRKVVVV
jgi:hypothetical protein